MKNLTPILLIAFLSSCMINRNYQAKVGLKYTGVYTVKYVQGKLAQFKELPDTYYVDSDTLKVNDKITINVIRDLRASEAKRNNSNLVKN